MCIFDHEYSVSIKGQVISVFYVMSNLADGTESKVLHTKESSTSLKVTDRPKVSFGPYVEKQRAVPGKQKQKELPKQTRYAAKGYYTPNPGKSGTLGLKRIILASC